MILTNFNIDVSCAANLVFWETVLSEQLRIWLCLFFLYVKMAARQNNRTSSVFYFIIQIVKNIHLIPCSSCFAQSSFIGLVRIWYTGGLQRSIP